MFNICTQASKDVGAAIAVKAAKQKAREEELLIPLSDSRLERERVENLKVFKLKDKQFRDIQNRVEVCPAPRLHPRTLVTLISYPRTHTPGVDDSSRQFGLWRQIRSRKRRPGHCWTPQGHTHAAHIHT